MLKSAIVVLLASKASERYVASDQVSDRGFPCPPWSTSMLKSAIVVLPAIVLADADK